MLIFDNIHFSWRETPLIQGFSAEVRPGAVIALSGDNGSGKSTLLKLASGMIPHFMRGQHFSGDVFFEGRSLKREAPKSFFPDLAYIPSRNQTFYFLGETLGEELHLLHALSAVDQETRREREALLNTAWPQWRADENRPFANMDEAELCAALMGVYVLQGARLFLLDEVYRHAAPALLAGWHRLFTRLSELGCAVVIAAHQRVPGATAEWTLKGRGVQCG